MTRPAEVHHILAVLRELHEDICKIKERLEQLSRPNITLVVGGEEEEEDDDDAASVESAPATFQGLRYDRDD